MARRAPQRYNWRASSGATIPVQPLRVSYTDGLGWRVLKGFFVMAGPMETRDEAQAWIDEQ